MGYLKIFTFLNFKTRSSQMVLLQKCISYFWEKGGQGLLPMGRVTVSRGCPQHGLRCRTALKDLNTTETRAYNWVCCWPQHSKQWTQPGCFRGIKRLRRQGQRKIWGQGQRKIWRQSYHWDISEVLLFKHFHLLFYYFKIWTIFLHACKISSNSENLNQAFYDHQSL